MRTAYLAFLSLPQARRAQTRPPNRKLPDVSGLLSALGEPFGGICAFCQIEPAKEIHRFRPTAYANPLTVRLDDPPDQKALTYELGPEKISEVTSKSRSVEIRMNLQYGWLADAWVNLYPICEGCIPSDPSQFPVVRDRSVVPTPDEYAAYVSENTGRWHLPIAETAVLVDPCADDPEMAIRLRPDGLLEGLRPSGTLTIDHFNLNRPELVAKRATGPVGTARAPKVPRERRAKPKPTGWELSRIRIENFKAIETLDIDMPMRPKDGDARAAALLILGENAAGKSTILEAVALALMTDGARRSLLEHPGRYLLDPRFMGNAELPARTESRIILDFVAGDTSAQVVARLTAQDMTVERGAEDLPQVFGYGAYRHYLDGVRRRGADQGVVSLFRSDRLLSNPRDWLLRMPVDRFREVVAALRFVFGVDFDAIRRGDTDCMVVTQSEGVETETPLLAVSSGFRTVLALVCDVLRWLMDAPATRNLRLEEMPALILIDEVEAHLHPRWKMAIVDGLRRALPAATFLVTTHDPLCLRRAAAEEVRVMTRTPAEGRTNLPVLVEALNDLPDMGALTVDQLLTADFFGLGDTDDPASVRALENLATQYATHVADPAAGDVVRRLQAQILRDLPIGRTEVERIVQEALSAYLTERRSVQPQWREQTKSRIVDLLRGL